MDDQIVWVTGIAISIVGLIGGVIMRDRYVMKALNDGDGKLHSRINLVKDQFVRKEDLDDHLKRMDDSMKELKLDFKERSIATNNRLDAIISAIGNTKP